MRRAGRRTPSPGDRLRPDGSLDDGGLSAAHLDLPDARGQLEGIVHVDSRWPLGRPRVVAQKLLKHALRYRDAGDLSRFELESADAILGNEQAARRQRQGSSEVAERIEPAALLLLSNRVEINSRTPAHTPVPHRGQRRLDDAARDLIGREV